MPTEAQKKAKADYKARMTKAGARHFGLWLSAEAWVALEALAKVHGSKVKAVEAAVQAAATKARLDAILDRAMEDPFANLTDPETGEAVSLEEAVGRMVAGGTVMFKLAEPNAVVLADAKSGRVEPVQTKAANAPPPSQAGEIPAKVKKAATGQKKGLSVDVPVAKGRLVSPKR